jgi:hypothetical protein
VATKSGNGVQIIKPKISFDETVQVLNLMAATEVLVGFPEENADRKEDADSKEPITNAALGYIHDNGAPDQNIPARPFMGPGIEAAREKIANKLGQIAKAVLKGGGADAVERGQHQVGIIASTSIKRAINEGIPPPLAESTLRSRVRRNSAKKGALRELDRRWDDQAPSTEFAKTLVETAQMRNAVSYAIRAKSKRK